MSHGVDLRSDTVTRPSGGMRRAMAEAEVGDDLFGEDPTVRALEDRTAELLGKEAAMLVPSGTMGNQVALKLHTSPGEQVLVGAGSHVCTTEAGAGELLSGVHFRAVAARRGMLSAAQVAAALPSRSPFRDDFVHPTTTLLCLENTHNGGGGAIWPLAMLQETAAAARKAGLAVHLDGARIWNAAAGSDVAESDLAAPFDTVNVCFSKGLGAPVGSALAGTAEAVRRARRIRQMFGGGMRQAGVFAAGALYAIERNRDRLPEDHARARRLAEGLAEMPGVDLDLEAVESNIVRFGLPGRSASEFVFRCHGEGVFLLPMGEHVVRAVTHMEIGDADIDRALCVMGGAVRSS